MCMGVLHVHVRVCKGIQGCRVSLHNLRVRDLEVSVSNPIIAASLHTRNNLCWSKAPEGGSVFLIRTRILYTYMCVYTYNIYVYIHIIYIIHVIHVYIYIYIYMVNVKLCI